MGDYLRIIFIMLLTNILNIIVFFGTFIRGTGIFKYLIIIISNLISLSIITNIIADSNLPSEQKAMTSYEHTLIISMSVYIFVWFFLLFSNKGMRDEFYNSVHSYYIM